MAEEVLQRVGRLAASLLQPLGLVRGELVGAAHGGAVRRAVDGDRRVALGSVGKSASQVLHQVIVVVDAFRGSRGACELRVRIGQCQGQGVSRNRGGGLPGRKPARADRLKTAAADFMTAPKGTPGTRTWGKRSKEENEGAIHSSFVG